MRYGRQWRGKSSPPMWGAKIRKHLPNSPVFLTHMGVFLTNLPHLRSGQCLPHACGGVSSSDCLLSSIIWSSPLTWGCFCERFFPIVCARIASRACRAGSMRSTTYRNRDDWEPSRYSGRGQDSHQRNPRKPSAVH